MRAAALSALLVTSSASCGEAPVNPPVAAALNDLAAAAPGAVSSGDRASTGEPARVVIGGRRESVQELFRRLVGALAGRDFATVATLFEPTVADTGEIGDTRHREEIVAEFEQALNTAALGQWQPSPGSTTSRVYSASEARDIQAFERVAMNPDDWLVIPTSPLHLLRTMIVRWNADGAHIVAIQRSRLQR